MDENASHERARITDWNDLPAKSTGLARMHNPGLLMILPIHLQTQK
jgi:hypothetical protein